MQSVPTSGPAHQRCRPHRNPAARLPRAQRVERGKALGLAALHAGARVLLLAELTPQGVAHWPDLRGGGLGVGGWGVGGGA